MGENMRYLISISLLLALAGCGTTAAQYQMALNAQATMKPTISLTCPAGGCTLDYTDPRDRGVRLPTNGWDAVVHVGDTLGGVATAAIVPLAIGHVAVSGFNALKGSSVTTSTTSNQIGPNSQNQATTTTTTTSTDSHNATAAPAIVTPAVDATGTSFTVTP
jgi:hypothetical protein